MKCPERRLLQDQKKKIVSNECEETKAHFTLHREKPGGIWSVANKKWIPKDLISHLRVPNSDLP